MRAEATVEAVRKTVRVEKPVAEAFRLFTEGIANWWPLPTHSVAGAEADSVFFEQREGGRVYERMTDGTIAYWAEVVVWEPPHRFVLSWQPNPDAPAPTEVEVTFTPEEGGTRIDLEHRGWERLGERAELARTEYETGWDGVLGLYAGASRENGLAIASFVLGLASLVVPLVALVGAPLGVLFGIIGRRRANRGARHGGLATAGIAVSAVALVLWVFIVMFVFAGSGVGGGSGSGDYLGPVLEPAETITLETVP